MKDFDYFKRDNKNAKPSENFCTILLENMSKGIWKSVRNVSEEKEFRKLGDIEVTAKDGTKIYFDVKDESRFCDTPDKPIGNGKSYIKGKKGTGNVLAEEWIDRYGKGTIEDGMMLSANYDYVIVFSWEGKQLLIVDFDRWKEVYDNPEFISLFHGKEEYTKNFYDQKSVTHGYLNNIEKLIEAGVIFSKVWFDYDGTKENPTNVRCTDKVVYEQYKSRKTA